MIMGWLLGGLAIGATAVVACAAVSFLCDELSESEIRRQRRMQDEYNSYESRRRQEYRETYIYYENARRQSEENYRQVITEYQLKIIKQRKEENKAVYDDMMKMYSEQYSEKEKLLKECKQIKDLCEKSIEKQQNTYMRFKSIKTTLISLEEAVYKLQAYLEYLENYKGRFNEKFENTGEIASPFSLTLPQDYPYEGKLMMLSKSDFRNSGYVFDVAGYIRIESSDLKLFEQCIDSEMIPFMMYKGKNNNKKYLSLSKGMLKRSIGGTIGIDAEVKKIEHSLIRLKFLGNEYIKINILKKDLLNQRRKTPIGSNLHVYIKDYDFALKKTITVSEKVGDGLSIAQFENIMMVQTSTERKTLQQYLKENDLLDEDDEWRIAPIWNADKSELKGVIMQVGNEYAYEAIFEEIKPGKLILRYKGRLDKDRFVSFDDVFVTTNVTVDCYSPEQLSKNMSEYENLFEECQKLQLYLISEFVTQNKMMVKSPMSIYLDQWEEITIRLIERLGYGGHLQASITERYEVRIGEGNCYCIFCVDNSDRIKEFVERENRNHRYKYFISMSENEKLPCRIQEEDDEIKIKVIGNISVDDLLERDFVLDLYSVAIPYAEKQHANALSAFKEGRVVNEKIKMAVLNIKDETYSDNGFRISSFYNENIQKNEEQIDAVVRAFGEEKFFMIQGPPGTGKTTVIKELILQQLNRVSNAKILVVSQANVAVDNVLRGIVEISKKTKFIEEGQLVRCGSVEKIADDIETYSFENKYKKYVESLRANKEQDTITNQLREKWIEIIEDKNNADVVGECLLGCFQIVGATCVGLESRHYGLNGIEFDLVIIDEAGKALAGELLIPINRARKTIIIGDHKQLPPVINPALYKGGKVNYDDVVEEEQRIDFLNKSFFQRLYEECPETMKCMLKKQFRMPPVIADLVNLFYDGQLLTGENCFNKKPMFLGNNLIFIDMKNNFKYKECQDYHANGSKSGPYNLEEISAATAIVSKIRKYYDRRIVIITPYKKQKNMLIKAFDDKKVWVNTIDAFQGDEEDIVIYCTTRAEKATDYFSDSARLNVAFSRARNTLIFLGSSNYLKKYPENHILHIVSNYLYEKACIVNYEDWIKEEFDIRYDADYKSENKECISQNLIITDFEKKDFFESVKTKVTRRKACESCGLNLNDNENILCSNCLEKTELTKCKCCGRRDIPYPLYDKYVLKRKPAVVCSLCIESKCEECNAEVIIEKAVYEELKKFGKKCLCKACIKKYKEIVYSSCEQCGKEIKNTYAYQKKLQESNRNLPTICPECKAAGNKLIRIGICEACGGEILQKAYIVKTYDIDNVSLHKECKEKEYISRRCINCDKKFSISYSEKKYYEKKQFQIPKKCKECREQLRSFS